MEDSSSHDYRVWTRKRSKMLEKERAKYIAQWKAEAKAEADNYKMEKAFFRFSLYYLFLHFGALVADSALRSAGLL